MAILKIGVKGTRAGLHATDIALDMVRLANILNVEVETVMNGTFTINVSPGMSTEDVQEVIKEAWNKD